MPSVLQDTEDWFVELFFFGLIIGLTAGEPDYKDMAMISAGATTVINKADVLYSLYPAIIDVVKNLKTAI